MFPLRDLNKPLTTPHVNRLLLTVNIVVFIVFWLASFDIVLNTSFANDMVQNFTMYPYEIIHGQRLFTLLTSMFMHDPTSLLAGLFHLGGNMLYLYVFGDNIEDTFGHFGYLVFYLFSGLVASTVYILSVLYTPMLNSLTGLSMSADLTEGLLGASGAIAGVLGAYIVLYPKARILTLIFYGWPIIVPIPAIAFLGFWFVLQWLYVFLGIATGVAYWAHIGGFIAGMILALVFGLGRKKAREVRRRL